MRQNRIIYVDFLKILACIAVITIHVTAQILSNKDVSSNGWIVMNFYNSMSRWAVPIFIMSSGVFIFNNNIKTNLKNAVKMFKILVMWSGVYFITNVYIYNKQIRISLIKEFIKKILNGTVSVHLWYIYMLIGLYIAAPIFKKIINNSSKKELEYFILVGVLCSIIIPSISDFLKFNLVHVFFSKFFLNIFTGYYLYLIVGYYISKYNVTKKFRKCIYIMGFLNLILTFFLTQHYSIIDGKINQMFYKNFSINVFIVSFSLFLMFKNMKIVDKKNKILGKTSNIVKYTFGIYLVHQLIINIFKDVIIDILVCNPVINTPIIIVCVFTISLIISIIINKFKLLRIIFL